MSTATVETFVRPNGKPYRPRNPVLVAHAWNNLDGSDDGQGCIVFGTLEPEKAQPFAEQMCSYWFGLDHAVHPRPGWFRLGYEHGEQTWLDDTVRGRPGVYFTAVDEVAS